MVSSTFEDFKQHREALIGAISGQGLHPVAMEHDSALPTGTVIDSSLQKVRDSAAYVGIIGARYGNIPDSAEHNPEGLSLTELEFREARTLGRPVLLFIMGPDHDVKQRDVEHRAISRSLSVSVVTLGSHELERPRPVAADPFCGFLDGVRVFEAE